MGLSGWRHALIIMGQCSVSDANTNRFQEYCKTVAKCEPEIKGYPSLKDVGLSAKVAIAFTGRDLFRFLNCVLLERNEHVWILDEFGKLICVLFKGL